MSSNVVPFTGNQMPAHLRNSQLPDMNAAAQAGVQESMPVVSYRGKNWRFKFRGDETLHVDGRGAPDPYLDVIVVGVADAVSKIYYEKKYSEGDDSAPDCWSTNGITPDASATNKQADACATCPMGMWGSAHTEDGRKKKACSDSKRLAIVPAADVENAAYGGPMMLRLPATTLQTFSQYSRQLAQFGAQAAQVVTRLSFDPNAAYPKIVFQPVGWIQDPPTAERAAEWATSDQVRRILKQEGEAQAPAQGMTQVAKALAQKPTHMLAAPAAAPATTVAPPVVQPAKPVVTQAPVEQVVEAEVVAPQPAQPPVQVQPVPDDMASVIDGLLA